jgi:hypothetical protein
MYTHVPYSILVQNPKLLWYRTVEEYSRLQLTFERDRMAALSALTQRMEKSYEETIDFWWDFGNEPYFRTSSGWCGPQPQSGRPSSIYMSSWSWAAVQSQVGWDQTVKSFLPSVKVLDIAYDVVGPTHLACVSSASITIRAPLIKASLVENQRGFRPSLIRREEIVIYDFKEDYPLHEPSKSQIFLDTEVFICSIGLSSLSNLSLLLRQIPDTHSYERIGRVELEHRDMKSLREQNRQETTSESASSVDSIYIQIMSEKKLMARMSAILKGLPLSDVTLV